MPYRSSLRDKIFKRDEAAALENLKPAIRSAVRALALTIQRVEREGQGPYDAPYSGLVERSAVLTQFIPCESWFTPASFDEQLPYQLVLAV